MSTASSRMRSAALAGALALGACIQGPWDYYPDNPPPFRGVYAMAYVLSGRPLQQVCFERVLDIAEEHTQAFAWYDSADVEISGPFGGTSRTVKLTPNPDTVDCFQGDTALRAERGNDYQLSARFTWDSAGTRVHSHVTGTAHVPASFSVHRTAAAPSLAKTGGIPDNVFDTAFLAKLPPMVIFTLRSEFGDSLLRLQNDSTALKGYIARHGVAIQNRLVELLEGDEFVYNEGDTLFYLNGVLNTLSHHFGSDRSEDVGAVLITQRFEKNSDRPETRFDSPFGLKPDSGRYYFPGDIRRLLLYPNATGANGYNLLDSMGVVNTWFHTLRNRLYFYGFEKFYYDYNASATQVQGGGGENGDPRVKPKYNVQGGEGFFVGGIPDSFDVYIKVDSLTKSYYLPAAHAARCRKQDGWYGSKDCREYYPEYCRFHNWAPPECLIDAIRVCVDSAAATDPATMDACKYRGNATGLDTGAVQIGQRAYCIEHDFPDIPACAASRAACLDAKGQNACKIDLWNFCLDRDWRAVPGAAAPSGACGPGLASYCHDRPRLSETLCRHADAWCADHKDSPQCN